MMKIKRALSVLSAAAVLAASVPCTAAEEFYDKAVPYAFADESAAPDEAYSDNFDVPNTKLYGDWIYTPNNDGTSCTIIEYVGSGGSVSIPEKIGNYTVTRLDYQTFYTTGLTSIHIPATVSGLSDDMFNNMISDEESGSYDSFTHFYNPYDIANTLESITVDPESSYYTASDGVLFNKNMTSLIAYPGAKASAVYTVPDGVRTIDDYAFRYAKNLIKVVIPDSVEYIYSYAFYSCPMLASVKLPQGLKSIYYDTFMGCKSLSDIIIPDSVTEIQSEAFEGCAGLTGIDIPDSVTVIGSRAFARCTGLTGVTISANVSSLGYGAFAECTSLKGVNVNAANPYYTSVGGIVYDKNKTELMIWPAGKSVASYTVEDGIASIGNYAFAGAKNLSSVYIPSSVIAINNGAFKNCPNLSEVSMNTGLKTIGEYAFSTCPKLTNVVFPEGLTRIGYHAFLIYLNNYTQGQEPPLRTFTVPASVNAIGELAFGAQHYYYDSESGKRIGTILYLYSGSYAEKYALKNDIKYMHIGNAKPVVTKIISGNGQVGFNWTAVGGATKYAVYYKNGSSWVNAGTTTACGKYVKGLKNGTKYAFIIKAYVYGEWISSATIYATPTAPAAKPVITKTIPGNGQVGLNWSAVSGATKYAVYYKSGSSWVNAGTTTALGKYVRGLNNGTKYAFIVKAYVNGTWVASSTAYATPTAAKGDVIDLMDNFGETDFDNIDFTDFAPVIKF